MITITDRKVSMTITQASYHSVCIPLTNFTSDLIANNLNISKLMHIFGMNLTVHRIQEFVNYKNQEYQL